MFSFINFYKSDVSVLPNILHSLFEYEIMNYFEEIFFKIIFSFVLRSAFMSMYGFNKAF